MTPDQPLTFTELLPPRQGGRVFEQSFRASLGDTAPNGRVRLDALGRWIQDVAYGDVEDAGFKETAVWVVRRMRICVSRFPQFGETVRLQTFCSGMGRMWAERRTSLVGETGSVETVALWVHLDRDSLRPAPFGPGELEDYVTASGGRKVRARLYHPLAPSGLAFEPWHFRAADLDLANHVNNAAYWCLAEERLIGQKPTALDAEIEFRSPARAGEAQFCHRGDHLWVSSRDGDPHASIVVRQGA